MAESNSLVEPDLSAPSDASWKQRRTIPPEITDLIIAIVGLSELDDYLEDLRRRSLLACALVCSTWLPASRRELFRKVEFNQWGPSLERFFQTDLHSQSMQHDLSYISEIHFDTLAPATSDQSCIHRLVGHIPNLETLHFRDVYWNDLSWHPSTFMMFSGFPALHTPALHDCTIPSFNALLHMLSAVSRLTALQLWMVDWPQPKRLNLPYSTVPGRRPALAFLEVILEPERHADLLQWLCTTSTIHSIKRISFPRVSSGEDGRDNFLCMSAPSIRELWCVAEDIKVVAQHIPHMINLEKLGVENWHGVDRKFATLYTDLSHALRHFFGQHFREIRLKHISGHDLDRWTEELWDISEETASDDEDKGHPVADDLELILRTRENMEKMAVVFDLHYSTEREQGDHFKLALQNRLPELYNHCVLKHKLW